MLINYSFEVNNLLQQSLISLLLQKRCFLSLNLHTSDNPHMIWTTNGHMFWATNRRGFEVTLKQIRGTCFMNEHRKHSTCCQRPVAAE